MKILTCQMDCHSCPLNRNMWYYVSPEFYGPEMYGSGLYGPDMYSPGFYGPDL